MSLLTAGRLCFSAVALAASAGSFASDWSKTHIFNPKWPPHAKFHNGQTISMGFALAASTMYYAWRSSDSIDAAKESVTVAAVFGSLYWVTGLAAWFYPGALGVDPEFGKGFPQGPIFTGWLALTWLGYWLEMRRLGAGA